MLLHPYPHKIEMIKSLLIFIFTIYIIFTGFINYILKYAIEKYVSKAIELLVSTSGVIVTMDINFKIQISVYNFTIHKPISEIRFKQPIIITINEAVIVFDIISIHKLITNNKLLILDSIIVKGASVNIEGWRENSKSKRILNFKLLGGEV